MSIISSSRAGMSQLTGFFLLPTKTETHFSAPDRVFSSNLSVLSVTVSSVYSPL